MGTVEGREGGGGRRGRNRVNWRREGSRSDKGRGKRMKREISRRGGRELEVEGGGNTVEGGEGRR